LPASADYVTTYPAEDPVLLSHSADDSLRVFSTCVAIAGCASAPTAAPTRAVFAARIATGGTTAAMQLRRHVVRTTSLFGDSAFRNLISRMRGETSLGDNAPILLATFRERVL
jgi:hypothetical protein